ncbi:MAG TPA: DUF927 domain-containing protein [Candidatus Acidoferrum sp.]
MNGHHVLPQLPMGYAWGLKDELLLAAEDAKGNPKHRVISTYPIFLAGVHAGETRGMCNYSFWQRKPHDGWSSFTLAASELHGARTAGVLADRGANVLDEGAFKQYVKMAVDQYHASDKMDDMYEQMGWKHDDTCFLLGTTLYTPEGKVDVQTSDELRIRSRHLGPAKGGSLAEWKRAIHALFAKGCEAQSFMVLCGFGASLIRLLDRTESGALVAVTATESGGGKSTTAVGATSIFGLKEALSVEKSFSAITRSLTFAALGNVVCVHDELRARDPDVVREFVIEYTNGTDKARANRSGELKQSTRSWQSLLLTCDNYSLVDIVSGPAAEHDEAPAMRIIELPLAIPSHLRKLHRDELKDTLERNSGYAADVFLEFITKPETLTKIKALLKTMYMEIYRETQWEHKHRFWVRTLACAAVGGIIARQLGLIECSVDRIIRWVIDTLKERVEPEKKIWQVGAFGHFLNSKLGERLTVDDAWTFAHRNVVLIEPRKGQLSIRHEEKINRYLISTSALRSYCIENGFNYGELTRFLTEQRVITGKSRQILGAGTQYAGAQVWVIAVDGNHPLLTGLPQALGSNSHGHRLRGADVVSLRQQSTGSIPPDG